MTRPHRHDFEASDPSRLIPDPEVTVGIVTYNHERYLADAIESVLAQRTSFGFELVIYEDCSTDGTRAIALDYQRRYPEIVRVLYSAANVGVGENVRRGIASYRGRYAAGVDGDDFWTDPLKLQKQFDALEAHPQLNLSISRGYHLLPDGAKMSAWSYGDKDRIVSRRELLLASGMVAPTASLFFRTKPLRMAPEWIFDAPVIDVFHIMAGVSPNGAYYIAEEMAAYRVMAHGSWSSRHAGDYDRMKVEHSVRMLESWDRAAADFGIDDSELRFVRSLPHYVLGRDALARGRYRAALAHFRRVGSRYIGLRAREVPGKLAGLLKARG